MTAGPIEICHVAHHFGPQTLIQISFLSPNFKAFYHYKIVKINKIILKHVKKLLKIEQNKIAFQIL